MPLNVDSEEFRAIRASVVKALVEDFKKEGLHAGGLRNDAKCSRKTNEVS